MFKWFGKKNLQQEQVQIKEQPVLLKSAKEIELELHLNQLVICVSNEVENLTVGYAKEIIYITKAKQPMLVVHDIVNKKEFFPFGTIFAYSEQKFNALNRLAPNERIAIIFNRLGTNTMEKTASDGDVIYPSEVWREKVADAVELWSREQDLKKTKQTQ